MGFHRARAATGEAVSPARVAFAASAAVAACAAASSAPALADAARASGVPFDRAREVMAFLSEKGAAFPLAEVRPELTRAPPPPPRRTRTAWGSL